MEIKIESCQDCPFANEDNEAGYNQCNLNKKLELHGRELPSDNVHEDCPLKEMTDVEITIMSKEEKLEKLEREIIMLQEHVEHCNLHIWKNKGKDYEKVVMEDLIKTQKLLVLNLQLKIALLCQK